MSADPGPPARGPTEHDRDRLRETRRVVAVGWLLAVTAAVVAGLAGLPGNVGFAALLLFGALSCAAGGLHALVLALVDDLRDRRTWRGRPLTGAGLLALAGLLMVMVGGALSV